MGEVDEGKRKRKRMLVVDSCSSSQKWKGQKKWFFPRGWRVGELMRRRERRPGLGEMEWLLEYLGDRRQKNFQARKELPRLPS